MVEQQDDSTTPSTWKPTQWRTLSRVKCWATRQHHAWTMDGLNTVVVSKADGTRLRYRERGTAKPVKEPE